MDARLTTYLRGLEARTGAEIYVVGGAVRDELLGRPPQDVDDIDLVARGVPEDALIHRLNMVGKAELTGVQFSVIRFFPANRDFDPFEIALPRTEVSTGDGHRDFKAQTDHTLPIEDDLVRRDFTVNAMARRVGSGELIDPLNGRVDLENGILRGVGGQTIKEDPLRIIRALRFVAKLGFKVDDETLRQMRAYAHMIEELPGERIQMELVKMVTQPHAADAFRLARTTGILNYFLPELMEGVGCEQNRWHEHDVFEHSMLVLENTDSDDPYVCLAALLHDVGKPRSKWVDLDVDPTGNPHFYEHKDVPGSRHHEVVGAEMVHEILRRFRFSNHKRDRVAALVREHMFPQGPNLRPRSARKLIARLDHVPGGIERNITGLFALRRGDILGGKVEGSEKALEYTDRFEKIVREELSKNAAVTTNDLAVSGHDCIEAGLEGREIGIRLKELLNMVIDNPNMNNRETLLPLLKQ